MKVQGFVGEYVSSHLSPVAQDTRLLKLPGLNTNKIKRLGLKRNWPDCSLSIKTLQNPSCLLVLSSFGRVAAVEQGVQRGGRNGTHLSLSLYCSEILWFQWWIELVPHPRALKITGHRSESRWQEQEDQEDGSKIR